MIALLLSPDGDIHDRLGVSEWYVVPSTVLVMPPPSDLPMAMIANTASTTSSVPSSTTWERAESSIPFQQIHVMAMMNRIPMVVVR